MTNRSEKVSREEATLQARGKPGAPHGNVPMNEIWILDAEAANVLYAPHFDARRHATELRVITSR